LLRTEQPGQDLRRAVVRTRLRSSALLISASNPPISARRSARASAGPGRGRRRAGRIGTGFLSQQLLDLRGELPLQLAMKLTARRRSEPGVNTPDPPVASNEDRGGPRVKIDRLRHLFPHFRRSARNQIRVLDTILFDERALALEAALLLGFFEIQGNDGEPLVAILLVELDQVLSFVVAIRAPRPRYDSLVKTCRSCHDVYKPPDI
jgi:hypothetical protein